MDQSQEGIATDRHRLVLRQLRACFAPQRERNLSEARLLVAASAERERASVAGNVPQRWYGTQSGALPDACVRLFPGRGDRKAGACSGHAHGWMAARIQGTQHSSDSILRTRVNLFAFQMDINKTEIDRQREQGGYQA